MARACGSYPQCPRFESVRRHHFEDSFFHRGVEQLVARRAHNPKVGGSSPPPATKYADVAQSAERILGKDKVTSSILVISSNYKQGFLCKREAFLLSKITLYVSATK